MGTISILIAHEGDIVRAGLRSVLSQEQDMTIVGDAADTKALLRLIERETPDILLLGLMLPKDEMIRVLKEIAKRNHATRPLVLMDPVSETDLQAMLQAGAKGCLPSHIPATILKKAVRVVASGEYWIERKTAGKLFSEFLQLRHSSKVGSVPAGLLTKREIEVLKLLANGFKNRAIAERLFISEKTVKTHLTNIFAKLKIKDRLQAALYVLQNHLEA